MTRSWRARSCTSLLPHLGCVRLQEECKARKQRLQLPVCDHNPLMQNRLRTTLIRVGVREKNEELSKFHSFASNELEGFLLQGLVRCFCPSVPSKESERHSAKPPGQKLIRAQQQRSTEIVMLPSILSFSRFVTHFHCGEKTSLIDMTAEEYW